MMILMTIFKSIKKLYQNRPDFVLCDEIAFLFVTLDITSQVAVFTVLHDNIDFLLLFIKITVDIGNNV